MTPQAFVETIYLGDRACKSLLLDGWKDRVVLEVNLISRVRGASGRWDFYNAEDIENGLIVFENATSISMSPSGWIPNDVLAFVSVETLSATDYPDSQALQYRFSLRIGSGKPNGDYVLVDVQIVAESIHLEDPRNPGVKITE